MELMEFAYDQAENALEEPEIYGKMALASTTALLSFGINGLGGAVYSYFRKSEVSNRKARAAGGAVFSGFQIEAMDRKYDLDGEYTSWIKAGYIGGGAAAYAAFSPPDEKTILRNSWDP